LWDLESGKSASTIPMHPDQITGFSFNIDGSLLTTTCKDKQLRIFDVRSASQQAATAAHAGSKTARCVWAKRRNQIVSIGFNKQQYRELMVFDPRNMSEKLCAVEVDQQSSVFMPIFDEDTSMLYLGGKGDGSIRYYEVWAENPPIVSLQSFSSTEAQRGLCMLPKTSCNLRECELAIFLKLTAKTLSRVHFVLPRKQSQLEFQEDVYPPTFANVPALSSSAFFAGSTAEPNTLDMKVLFAGGAPKVEPAKPRAAEPAAGAGAQQRQAAGLTPTADQISRQEKLVCELRKQVEDAKDTFEAMKAALSEKAASKATPPKPRSPEPAASIHHADPKDDAAKQSKKQPEVSKKGDDKKEVAKKEAAAKRRAFIVDLKQQIQKAEAVVVGLRAKLAEAEAACDADSDQEDN
jgi:coronin-1B/1C/6